MFGGLRFYEILIILLVVVVIFGKDRLPHLGSSLGQAIRNFKKGFGSDDEAEQQEGPAKQTPTMASGSSAPAANERAKETAPKQA